MKVRGIKPLIFRQLERKSDHYKICQNILHNVGLSPRDKCIIRVLPGLEGQLASCSSSRLLVSQEGRKEAKKHFWRSQPKDSSPLKIWDIIIRLHSALLPLHLATIPTGLQYNVYLYWESHKKGTLFKEFLGKPKAKSSGGEGSGGK